MEITTEEKQSYQIKDLHTVANYARMKGCAYNTIIQRIGLGKIKSIFISGVQFVIENNDKK